MNLFATIEQNGSMVVNRIPISSEIQQELDSLFEEKQETFFKDKTIIPFDGSYNTDKDEIFELEEFKLEGEVLNAADNALSYDILKINNPGGKIKSLFAAKNHINNPEYYFQFFDSRKIIANRGLSIFLKGNTYRKFDDQGIVIAGDLTAVYVNGNLFFTSYHNTNRIFDLSSFYKEATEEDITEFINVGLFEFEDQIEFRKTLNPRLRKKLKGILDRGVLKNTGAKDIFTSATKFGIDFNLENNQIKVPDDKGEVKELIKFLDEDYFVTPLTKRKCVTNSKREL